MLTEAGIRNFDQEKLHLFARAVFAPILKVESEEHFTWRSVEPSEPVKGGHGLESEVIWSYRGGFNESSAAGKSGCSLLGLFLRLCPSDKRRTRNALYFFKLNCDVQPPDARTQSHAQSRILPRGSQEP